ncbi:hypothetical protein [Luteibacter yeojuensis]|uniref:Uncharacterized protein n=1 Tax=Luteibacter yeojuensis TaxID=345309 RepID=A0A0F3KMS0_9GAMM|nr:hypothetical protein [Luteibacter yeojuensis]KJV32471.1 hypothetical protein VI08_12035 [Luteibacter yeojuensis]
MRHVTGYFRNQGEAASVVSRLLGRGVPREHVFTLNEDDFRGLPIRGGHADDKADHTTGELRRKLIAALASGRPEAIGNSVVTVVAGSGWSDLSLRAMMEEGGAESVIADGELNAGEAGDEALATPDGTARDVNRAIEASRRGAAGNTHLHHQGATPSP